MIVMEGSPVPNMPPLIYSKELSVKNKTALDRCLVSGQRYTPILAGSQRQVPLNTAEKVRLNWTLKLERCPHDLAREIAHFRKDRQRLGRPRAFQQQGHEGDGSEDRKIVPAGITVFFEVIESESDLLLLTLPLDGQSAAGSRRQDA